MICDPKAMLKACARGMTQAQNRVGITNPQTALLMEFAGSGRAKYYEDHGTSWGDVVSKVACQFPGIPFVGALCAGQFAEHRSTAYSANAHSVWFTCVSTERNYRGKNRSELQRIQSAATDLLTRNTPDEVLEKALKGAIAAGAEGGCISRLNAGTGRILGAEGKAKSRDGSKQKWELSLPDVDYPGPTEHTDTAVPNYLAAWTKPALAGIAETALTANSTNEHMLEIVARTKHALFLPDPRNACKASTLGEY